MRDSKLVPSLVFVALQITMLGCAVAYARLQLERDRPRPFEASNVPAKVAPLRDVPEIVSDEQLRRVLERLQPELRRRKPTLNQVEHALRCWGAGSTFASADCLSGTEMRDLIVDAAKFHAFWPDARPLLAAGPRGVIVRTQDGPASATHVDHTLAMLGEIGTPLDFPLKTMQGPAPLREMLRYSTEGSFSLNQIEYEWSILAFALYRVEPGWTTSEGQQIDFDRLAHRAMRQQPGQGVCFGQHRLYDLVMLLRIDASDADRHLLSPLVRREVVDYLGRMTAELIANQHADGYINGLWGGPRPAGLGLSIMPPDSLTARWLATGHSLECWAMAPDELLPPRETLVRAGQWLCRTIAEADARTIADNYTYLTHAGRALALWRGRLPADVSLGADKPPAAPAK